VHRGRQLDVPAVCRRHHAEVQQPRHLQAGHQQHVPAAELILVGRAATVRMN
jgi:hypothetical protein